jgi:hypothetical protein
LIIDWSRGVDGERYIEIVKPIPSTSEGKTFELRRETLGAYDKGKAGLVLEEQVLLVDAKSGEVYTKFIGSSFFVGQVPPPETHSSVSQLSRRIEGSQTKSSFWSCLGFVNLWKLLMVGRLWGTQRTKERGS